MSLMIIALTGILLGFVCLMVGFFMEGVEGTGRTPVMREKKTRGPRKRLTAPRRKAA